MEWDVSSEECNIQQRQGETVKPAAILDPAGSQNQTGFKLGQMTSLPFLIFTCSKIDLFKTKVINQEAVRDNCLELVSFFLNVLPRLYIELFLILTCLLLTSKLGKHATKHSQTCSCLFEPSLTPYLNKSGRGLLK